MSALLLALLLASFASNSLGVVVSLYETRLDRGGGRTEGKVFSIDPPQRCYSFSCYAGQVSEIHWREMQPEAVIAFYRTPNCDDPAPHNFTHSKGNVKLANFQLDNQVESIMVLESGKLPTRGLIDVCPDEPSNESLSATVARSKE